AAVVYFATRSGAEQAARHLAAHRVPVAAFHAGLKPPEKRRVLEQFLRGELPVVCATNAFGMGISKDNVRLVVHADIPGSLESYLQEAGRAGRDGRASACVLLLAESDVERQFKLAAESRLSRRDIAQILRGLRRLARHPRGGGDPEVVVTSGELLTSDQVDTSFESQDRGADTKVKTAVAWLERATFVERNENHTRVFQGRPRVASLSEASRRLDQLLPPLSRARREQWLAILSVLFNCEPDQGVTADQLAELPQLATSPGGAAGSAEREGRGSDEDAEDRSGAERAGERVLRILHQMAELGLIDSGLQLTAYLVRRGGSGAAQSVFDGLCRLERAMLETLEVEAPEAGDGEWCELSLRRLNQSLCEHGLHPHPETLRQLLQGLQREGKAEPGRPGSLELVYHSRYHYGVRLPGGWPPLRELAERRRGVAGLILGRLLALAPAEPPGTVQVAFAIEDLTAALRNDLELAPRVSADPLSAVERALLFLHEQKVIQLQQGLAVFRQAMTIRIRPERKGQRFTDKDFAPLHAHYAERTVQIHVMARYAELAMADIPRALDFVDDYFELDRRSFFRRHFPGEAAMLGRATGRESFHAIVQSLGNDAQVALVTAPTAANLLILAGPGAGKTRVVVHRAAYLLRVKRVPARAILVVCFNRGAAREISRRLRELIGDDARGVT
ncbi:MAG: UvrD-helicase domain-containing protein, partial [Acidobacteriota bacterium]|nr:UvrD-helicase domain-containing protein [Acidobacteriota bacterium]